MKKIQIDKEKFLKMQSLNPVDNANITGYKDALDYALEDDDIRSIALSGAYGSGKSSILKTYKRRVNETYFWKRKKFIHISLAHFDGKKLDYSSSSLKKLGEFEKDEYEISESLLERKIFNQLLYQISSRRIPKTKFPIKKNASWLRSILVTSIVIFYGIAFLYGKYIYRITDAICKAISDGKILDEKIMNDIPLIVLETMEMLTYNENIVKLYMVGLSVITVCVLFFLIRMLFNRGILKRFKLKDVEFEIDYKKTDSFFDTYLSDVLYLFSNCDADVIVFEDIDRFEKTRIFERLREINTLVNHMKQKQISLRKKKVLKFMYLIRDDVFSSKDRTKFFDLIIPVVPYMSNRNSHDKIQFTLEMLKQMDLVKDYAISEEFMENVALYIDDMRFLKNVCNEYCMYAVRLNRDIIVPDKLFAMTIYKNLFPKDYVNSMWGQGFVSAMIEDITKQMKNVQQSIIVSNQFELSYRTKLSKYVEINKSRYKDALRYFLSEGYIDETYQDYMVYVDGLLIDSKGTYSPRVVRLLQMILAKKEINSTEDIELCYSRCKEDVIKRKNIIEYLLVMNKSEYKEVLKRILREMGSSDLEVLLKQLGNTNSFISFLYTYVRDREDISLVKFYFKCYIDGYSRENLIFNHIDLKDANLENANLQNFDLRYADLNNAMLQNAKLNGADLRGAMCEGTNMEGADLRLAKFEIMITKGVLCITNMIKANLSNAKVDEADMRGVNLKNAKLFNVNLRTAKTNGIRFKGSQMYSEDYTEEERSEFEKRGVIFVTKP